ncbi:substrate-binding domain-containing protein [Sphingomonas aerolata]|uniref:substrate-binding domain-containing protein n=1 Tax=Sphingomonas aerolata TaxID=185951 RepID=UPI002FE2E2BB
MCRHAVASRGRRADLPRPPPARQPGVAARAGGGAAPIVNGCEYSADLGVPSVHIDNAAASAEAIAHLADLGHRAIGVVTGPEISPISRDRLAGALRAADLRGLRDALHVEIGDYSAGSAFVATQALLAAGVTAIFCFSDEMALGALSAIGEAGLSCPRDVSVMGFDDLPLARYFQPALTTIAQPKGMIGQRTVELLVDILRGVECPRRQTTLAHTLVVRGSTAGPRTDR